MNISEEMKLVIKETHVRHLNSWTDIVGDMQIGYSHKLKKEVPRMTIKQCNLLLERDINRVVKQVNELLQNTNNIPQNHFDVFCSLVYDYDKAFIKNSTFYKLYIVGKRKEAKDYIKVWVQKKGVTFKAFKYRRTIDIQIYEGKGYKKPKKIE